MTPLSPKAQELYDYIQELSREKIGELPSLPYSTIVGYPRYNIKVSAHRESIIRSLNSRYYTGNDDNVACQTLNIYKSESSLCEHIIVNETSIVAVDMEGEQKMFFGSFNFRSMEILAGSLGNYEGQDSAIGGMLATYIDNQLVSMLLAGSQGTIIVHANLLIKGNKVIMLAGKSGTGKTTTSYLLTKQGYSLFTDDLLLIDMADNTAYPGPKKPKIQPPVDSSFRDEPSGFTELAEKEIFICFLNHTPDTLAVNEMNVSDAVAQFMEHSFAAEQVDIFRQISFFYLLLGKARNYLIKFSRHEELENSILKLVDDGY